jgi:ubiquitin carboxyl-terminal hydrolase 34
MIQDYKQKNMVNIKSYFKHRDTSTDDNLLHQLQKLFTFLQLSNKEAYDTLEFAFSYKYLGKPVDPSIQEDTTTFLTFFFDNLENFIKDTPFKTITKDIFGGTHINQKKCSSCGAVSETE